MEISCSTTSVEMLSKIAPCIGMQLLNILDTTIRFELATRALPVQITIDHIMYDLDDSIDRTDKL